MTDTKTSQNIDLSPWATLYNRTSTHDFPASYYPFKLALVRLTTRIFGLTPCCDVQAARILTLITIHGKISINFVNI
jgi:hypothetical protein